MISDLYVAAAGEAAAIKAEIDVTISNFRFLHKKGDVLEKAIDNYAKKNGRYENPPLEAKIKSHL